MRTVVRPCSVWNLEGIDSKGYVFQVDLAWRSEQAGLNIVEVPITFVEREIGASKMDATLSLTLCQGDSLGHG